MNASASEKWLVSVFSCVFVIPYIFALNSNKYIIAFAIYSSMFSIVRLKLSIMTNMEKYDLLFSKYAVSGINPYYIHENTYTTHVVIKNYYTTQIWFK